MKRIVAILLVLSLCMALCACDSSDYKKAVNLYENGEYEAALETFLVLGDYEESKTYVLDCKYQLALEAMERADYATAVELLTDLGAYKDCSDLILECEYQTALTLLAEKEYVAAIETLVELGDYKDCADRLSGAKCDMLYHYVKDEGSVEYQIGNNAAQLLRLTANDNGTINITMKANYSFFTAVFQTECKLTLEYGKEDAEYFIHVVGYVQGSTGKTVDQVTAKVKLSDFHSQMDVEKEMEVTSATASVIEADGSGSMSLDISKAYSIVVVSPNVHKAICENLSGLLGKTNLGITTADLGFSFD